MRGVAWEAVRKQLQDMAAHATCGVSMMGVPLAVRRIAWAARGIIVGRALPVIVHLVSSNKLHRALCAEPLAMCCDRGLLAVHMQDEDVRFMV